MSRDLLVSTRKGLFIFGRGSSGWTVRSRSHLGDNVTLALNDPVDGALYAALEHGHFGPKLHRSLDRGATWEEVTCPAHPEADDKKSSTVCLWSLETAEDGEAGQLWAGTIPGGLFRSRDGGENWEMNEPLWNHPDRKSWFGGGRDQPGIHSICRDPRDVGRILLGVSCGGTWLTEDGGESWMQTAVGMFADYMPPEQANDPGIQDPHRIVQGKNAPDTYWCQHHCGVYRSTDGGRSWQAFPQRPPSVFGFAVAVHPQDADTAWFVPAEKDEHRIPVDGRVVVTRTRDGGESWEVLDSGLPSDDAYDLVFRHALDVDDEGRCVAFGSTTGALWASANGGDDWELVNGHLPPIHAVRFA